MTKALNINNLNSELLTHSKLSAASRHTLCYLRLVNLKENKIGLSKDRSKENLLWTLLFFVILSILK
jgi:hypothetical protein